MTRCLSRIFRYLERFAIPRWQLPSLEETGFCSFYDLIDRKRAGEQIDQTLVNNTLAVYSEIGESTRLLLGTLDPLIYFFFHLLLNNFIFDPVNQYVLTPVKRKKRK